VLNGKLCVFGGLSFSQGLLNDMFFLNLVSIKGKKEYDYLTTLAHLTVMSHSKLFLLEIRVLESLA
jgi:hypothetical protein